MPFQREKSELVSAEKTLAKKCWLVFSLLFLGTVFVLSGCQAWTADEQVDTSKHLLKPVSPSLDAVHLDIVYIERDKEDPLLGQIIWDEMDEVGTIDLETRSRLREQGFRVGLVGMTPPRSLQRLLGLKNELPDAADTSRHMELIGRRTFLPSGGTTIVQTGLPSASLEITLPGETEPVVYKNVQTVLKCEVERLQDGWINLHLVPEVHHGAALLRPEASPTGFELKGGKVIEQLRDLEFSVTMNIGEMLVISSDQETDNQLADKFFINRYGPRDRRFLVAIRLTDMNKIQPLYEE